jgi:cellulose synthase (UDP-forming)
VSRLNAVRSQAKSQGRRPTGGSRPAHRSLALAASAIAVALGPWYLLERLRSVSGGGPFAYVFLAAELLAWFQLTVTSILLSRASWRTRPAPPPRGISVDVFVTVCGEPLEMVAATVRAALGIRYPHCTYVLNDGRVAGLTDWAHVERMSRELGVTCFTRKEGNANKAGNLNYALARTSGDFVVTIDADHVSTPDLLESALGWFADARVGFVATRQAFAVERDDPFYNSEHFFYDYLQPAKDRDGAAFSCGNGSLYRRNALDSIGGFSEWNLVEDLHTSYCLHAAGWRSVYHPVAVTIGSAPVVRAVYLKQRMRWAVDSLRLLLFDSPLWKPGLTMPQRIQYLHTTSFYLFAAVLTVFLIAPALSGVFGLGLKRAGTGVDPLLATSYVVALAAFLWAHAGDPGPQRILQAHLFAAPVYLLAIAYAMLGRRPDPSPTEKRRIRTTSGLVVLPSLILASLLGAIVSLPMIRADLQPPFGELAWATFIAMLLVGPLVTTNPNPRVARRNRRIGRIAVLALGAVSCIAVFP